MTNNLFKKISVGTVQFGMENYGILGTQQIQLEEIKSILDLLYTKGSRYIDTAPLYGDSEKNLGKAGVNDWRVMSKMPPINPNNLFEIKKISSGVSKSLKNLSLKNAEGLFIHDPSNATHKNSGYIFDALFELKSKKIINNIGVSVYTPEELIHILDRFDVDMVQIPMNIFDQRFKNEGLLDLLEQRGINVHVRSVFLQGILLKNPLDLPAYFNTWKSSFEVFHNYCGEINVKPLQVILNQILNEEKIDKVILGFDSLQSVNEIIYEIDSLKNISFNNHLFSETDINLLEPRLWPSAW
jgi:hypothetical protein|tara:strand:+ start:3213 stop:4106 length:894 start_codon:yes stop_codon:yes gene_type:complete